MFFLRFCRFQIVLCISQILNPKFPNFQNSKPLLNSVVFIVQGKSEIEFLDQVLTFPSTQNPKLSVFKKPRVLFIDWIWGFFPLVCDRLTRYCVRRSPLEVCMQFSLFWFEREIAILFRIQLFKIVFLDHDRLWQLQTLEYQFSKT